MSKVFHPAECVPGCGDPFCPYTHKGAWVDKPAMSPSQYIPPHIGPHDESVAAVVSQPFGARITFEKALEQFREALTNAPAIAERVNAGKQFNCYDRGDDEDADERPYALCVGPITDSWFVTQVDGDKEAAIVEAALKVATEAHRENYATPTRSALIAQLVEAVNKLGLRNLVAGWNGENKADGPYEPHQRRLGVTLRTNAGTVYDIDAALTALAAARGEG